AHVKSGVVDNHSVQIYAIFFISVSFPRHYLARRSRLFHLRLFLIAAVSKLRLSLAWRNPQYAISDGRLTRPHIPATRLFVLFHPSKAPPSHPQKKEYSLLVLLSVHTIINFATEFFEMFTKKQS
ncbi:MAG: hypothetical protein PUE25_06765, partial [bacterium]|nr:hypothetical protein [bacterium]